MVINLNPSPPPKCAVCGKPRSNHRAHTFQCPLGRKHRVMGYTDYHATNVFVEKTK